MKNNPTNMLGEGARLVPELRFPEFLYEGEWSSKSLLETATFVNDKCSIEDIKKDTYISTENIQANFGGIKTITHLPGSGSFNKFQKGDILFSNIRPYLRKIWLATFDGAASNDILIFRVKEDANNIYVAHLLKSDSFVQYCMIGAKGVKMPRGDKEMMEKYILPIPSPVEQQKIAQCLYSLDELITATREKQDQLKEHKKGLMQKLFPAKGKTLPELRFPEFNNEEEWEEEVLGMTYKVQGGFAFKSNEFRTNGVPIIRISNIPNDSLNVDLSNCVFYEDLPNMSNFIVRKGDLVIAMSGATTGKTAKYKEDTMAYLNQRVGIFRSKSSSNKYSFLCQWIQSDHFANQLLRILAAGAQPNISSTDIENITWRYPKNIKEQQKIAFVLSSIDEMIEQYYEKLKALEQHKKGLMQQLFPQQ